MKLTKLTQRMDPEKPGQWKVHNVVVADPGSQHFRQFAESIASIGKESPEWYAAQVNGKNEAGVFFPKLHLTLLPMSRHDGRDDFGNREMMARHVEDVFRANEEYCANHEICFDLAGEKNFDTATFVKELEEALANRKQWQHTKKVSLMGKGDSK